jgi:hypothetical protein
VTISLIGGTGSSNPPSSSAGHTNLIIAALANTLPAPATWLITPSETRRRCPVVVRAELEEMAQKAPALRDAKGERVADAGALGPRALGAVGKPETAHLSAELKVRIQSPPSGESIANLCELEDVGPRSRPLPL